MTGFVEIDRDQIRPQPRRDGARLAPGGGWAGGQPGLIEHPPGRALARGQNSPAPVAQPLAVFQRPQASSISEMRILLSEPEADGARRPRPDGAVENPVAQR